MFIKRRSLINERTNAQKRILLPTHNSIEIWAHHLQPRIYIAHGGGTYEKKALEPLFCGIDPQKMKIAWKKYKGINEMAVY